MSNLRIFAVLPLLLLFTSVTGCLNRKNASPVPSVSEEAREELAASINCHTARQDIQTLEAEKASVGKQVLAGVRSVIPFSAAVGILLGDYRDRAEVATGQYNRDLESKITQIQEQCNIM